MLCLNRDVIVYSYCVIRFEFIFNSFFFFSSFYVEAKHPHPLLRYSLIFICQKERDEEKKLIWIYSTSCLPVTEILSIRSIYSLTTFRISSCQLQVLQELFKYVCLLVKLRLRPLAFSDDVLQSEMSISKWKKWRTNWFDYILLLTFWDGEFSETNCFHVSLRFRLIFNFCFLVSRAILFSKSSE